MNWLVKSQLLKPDIRPASMCLPPPLCASRDDIVGGVTEMTNLTFSFNHMLEDIVIFNYQICIFSGYLEIITSGCGITS